MGENYRHGKRARGGGRDEMSREPVTVLTTHKRFDIFAFVLASGAEVMELVDVRRSGRRGLRPVWVRIPPSAP